MRRMSRKKINLFFSEVFMSSAICFQSRPRQLSVQMRAIIMILESDPHLKEALSPHIDLNMESIYWDKIFKLQFGPEQLTVVGWLYVIWTDELRQRVNLFDGSVNLPPRVQAAILNALALRW